MEVIEKLKKDLERYDAKAIVFFTCLALLAGSLLAKASFIVFTGGYGIVLGWLLLSVLVALNASRYAINILSTGTGVSASDALIFFCAISLGSYHAALLVTVDMLLSSWRLKSRPTLCLFNIFNSAISIYFASQVYYWVARNVASTEITRGLGQDLAEFALPLMALALVYYVLQFAIVALLSLFTGIPKISDRLRDTWPWEPMTFMAGAIVAGLVNYALLHQGLFTTAMILVLVLPIPFVIYYTFKTYHDKLEEQEKHYGELTNIYDSILEMLAMAIDAKDDVTHDHIQRVKLFARRMGEQAGLSDLEIEALKAGALLHDIGKIGVPAYILNKPGKLTEHEFEQMKMHTIIGADMLSNVDFRYPIVPIVRHHHERWDGRGYPDGLKGEQIPITARILTLVDNYDALRSDRPYKKGMSREEALAYIEQNAGTFFDPSLVEIFLSMVDDLEVEAADLKSTPPAKRGQIVSRAMAAAKPANGLDSTPYLDRVTAALNSIAETNQRVTGLYEMSRRLASLLSLEDTVAILANRLSKLVPHTTCAISLFDPSRSEFEIVHAAGRYAEEFLKRRQHAEAGITGYVITNQIAMYNTNPMLDLRFLGSEKAGEYKGVVVFPLVKNKESLGAIALYSTEISTYGSEHINLMESVSQAAADAIYNALAFEQAQKAPFTDPATGLTSMRAFITQFDREFARSQRLGTSLSLIVVKAEEPEGVAVTNQRDQILFLISKLLKQKMRETDMIARWDSNILIALLPDSGQASAAQACKRIGEALFGIRESNLIFSIGSATSPDNGDSLNDLIKAAQMRSADSFKNVRDSGPLDFKESVVVS